MVASGMPSLRPAPESEPDFDHGEQHGHGIESVHIHSKNRKAGLSKLPDTQPEWNGIFICHSANPARIEPEDCAMTKLPTPATIADPSPGVAAAAASRAETSRRGAQSVPAGVHQPGRAGGLPRPVRRPRQRQAAGADAGAHRPRGRRDQRLRLLPRRHTAIWARTWRSLMTPRSLPTAGAPRTIPRRPPRLASPPALRANVAMSAEHAVREVRLAGYGDAQIIEIVQHVALNTWTNYIDSVAHDRDRFPGRRRSRRLSLPTLDAAPMLRFGRRFQPKAEWPITRSSAAPFQGLE